MPTAPVTGQLLAHLKARRFSAIAKLMAPNVDFQGWTPAGHWSASDPKTAAQIIEVWLSSAAGCKVLNSEESSGAGGTATLECELAWHRQSNWGVPARGRPANAPSAPPAALDTDPLVILRQLYLLTVRNGLITRARVYSPGPRNEAPDVDLQRQLRTVSAPAATPPR